MTKRRLILLVVALLIVVSIKKARSRREAEWHGLTESQARAKLDAKLPSRIPADKRSAISDKVVAKMRDKGIITNDPDVPDEPSSTTEATAEDAVAGDTAVTADDGDETVHVSDNADKTVDLRDGVGEAAELAQN